MDAVINGMPSAAAARGLTRPHCRTDRDNLYEVPEIFALARNADRPPQALVLARHGISGAAWWAVANPPAWALGWLVTSYVISRNIDERWANFGASGAVLFGLLTWLVLSFLLQRTKSEALGG